MTKLEQKLIELGYIEQWNYDGVALYIKNSIDYETCIFINKQKITSTKINVKEPITQQYQLDNLQQAFNQLQNDLKELKEYE